MKALVTGATGFVGSAVVRSLLRRGAQVRALARRTSSLQNLTDLDVQVVLGELTDEPALARALHGCDVLYHVAAAYSTAEEDAARLYQVNVGGTKAVMRAAQSAGVPRVVYTSTIGAIGQPEDGRLATEEVPFNLWDTASHYAKSKVLGEMAALRFGEKGLSVVVVNPCAPVGPRDIGPSSTGARILDYLRGKVPSFPGGGINFVSVDDVADGHVLAAELGRAGEKYILGHGQGNLMLSEFQALMERVSGVRPARASTAPRYWVRAMWALGSRHIAAGGSQKPASGPDRRPARLTCNPVKAIRELGLPQTPLEEAFSRSVAWFRENGYVRLGEVQGR